MESDNGKHGNPAGENLKDSGSGVKRNKGPKHEIPSLDVSYCVADIRVCHGLRVVQRSMRFS